MLADYHIHTELCGHASGEMEEYVRHALKIGLNEIGFCDHLPMFKEQDKTLRMSLSDLPVYVENVRFFKGKFKNISIKLGTEVDYIPGNENDIKKLTSQYDFDYMMGSVHYIDDWMVDSRKFIAEYEKRDIDEVYEQYFNLIKKAVESRLFNTIGHIDLIKKFGHRPKKDIRKTLEILAKALRDNQVCTEVSTAGLRKPVAEIYPTRQILEICFNNDVGITLGSDAHKPEEVGYEFGILSEFVRKVGYRKIVTYLKKNPVIVYL